MKEASVAVQTRPTMRRELLRWRDLIAALYADPEPRPGPHAEAFRCLLRFTPGSSRQAHKPRGSSGEGQPA